MVITAPKNGVIRYHGGSLAIPQNPGDLPAPVFLDWHRREVFKGIPRHEG